MKLNLPRTLLCILLLSAIIPALQAQQDHFAYAITSEQKNGTDWIALRKLDTRTGEFSTVLLNGSDNSIKMYDAVTKNEVANFAKEQVTNTNLQLPFAGSVAAIAYDKKSNRLYYTPMFMDQLRYIELSTMKVFCVSGQSFSSAGNFVFQAASPISRMVIAPDGYGYTVTNDGNHLFRFNTTGTPVITDMGELADEASNAETIHNACGNAGGDMVADDNGSLYIISSSNRVFKVDIGTKRTGFMGNISGLPQQFTTSGVAVDENGKLVIGSSQYAGGYYVVDPKNWVATPGKIANEIYMSADLANSNTIVSNPAYYSKTPSATGSMVKAYPNPINEDAFSLQFTNITPGNYTVQLTDAVGNGIVSQKIKITRALQTETIAISAYNAQGFYFLKILDANQKTINTQILVVQR